MAGFLLLIASASYGMEGVFRNLTQLYRGSAGDYFMASNSIGWNIQ